MDLKGQQEGDPETMQNGGVHRLAIVSFFVVLCLSVLPISVKILSAADSRIQAPVAGRTCPYLENRFESEHFVLLWTDSSSHPADNIDDRRIIEETAVYFETAWDKLTGLFGRKPYIAPGSSKIEVNFRDLDCYAYADPPGGPIVLNSHVWVEMPSVRQPTSAHELFHKIQYAYGYKTRWLPRRPYLWFTEGTAAWAEVFVWGRVSRSCKMVDMFKDKTLTLYESEDMALPFWIYFVSGNSGFPNDRLMVDLLEGCEKRGNVNRAVSDVIRRVHGSVDGFFIGFDRSRLAGFWREPALNCPYAQILGPDGRNLVAEIKRYQEHGRGWSQDRPEDEKKSRHPPNNGVPGAHLTEAGLDLQPAHAAVVN